ncbi:Carbamoyl-phosphate synthase large chain [Candidatus Kinetoplastibacterium sorsogonicusi]|uniref:Carbamoyl phosphate synthase large chain n=1 Tax=Candidatus Kinetoplastidibacterium kentomonadis TaxID=1576550 RepID=A0A3Q8F398_9PROT|nr:carbamoyl-phosphate synthase large subunit [Candidatus Kinetoplastibacterium sorsogonicusi]AWD32279.1 Carbamoyl-phosphate synthase large chain [Candidatus Kinetoplastibacterium sorsogonicusi]
MPKRKDLHSILIIGSGPIVIGQACEFDYSGVQACKAFKEENYKTILVNSNPATIMTDPETADVVYIEPINWQSLEKIIEKERPDALLPTMGGQTALNCALDLSRNGVLKKYNVELIGANSNAIEKAEDRQLFKKAMDSIGLQSAKSDIAHSLEEAWLIQKKIAIDNNNNGFPIVIRPSFTMGGSGGGIAYNSEEFETICNRGLEASPTHELLIEESLLGWKEFEMEVIRDKNDNCIIVCSIENLDPMGIHTGDSITVAPAQTLTDKEYQIMRDASFAVLREIGVDTGGSNVQFAVNPINGRMIVIEMNPRVSRSSALASKATGFPIAKIAALLSIGYTLDELSNDITGGTMPASFEPSIDYIVTKIPRFAFEKFVTADSKLTTQMKSVGEVMAIGRTFQESFQKALRSLEVGVDGLNQKTIDREILQLELGSPGPERIWYIGDAFAQGFSIEDVHKYTKIDAWFLSQIKEIVDIELSLELKNISDLNKDLLLELKRRGFSDARLAYLLDSSENEIRKLRHNFNIRPVYKRVDTCAAEFSTSTAYLYSTYEDECESDPSNKKKIMILGGGPNRIGQGIEFDYCCVHAAMALHEDGYETIMINCNPETVSTDYDISDRLYFEPLSLENVLEIFYKEQPYGVIVQYGGQTPLKLARALEANGVPIIGTSPDSIDIAEDRERFQKLIHKIKLLQPKNATARNEIEAISIADNIGYPLVVRPSYVLGGRAMEIVHERYDLERYMREAVKVSNDSPVLLDSFLNNAIEVDVDCICDGKDVFIGGIMEHIEQAGVHSGDSACSLPPYSLSEKIISDIKKQTTSLAKALNVKGLMNVQFAIQDNVIYILEVNPRASRTIPYVSKATGLQLAKVAARVMVGQSLKSQNIVNEITPNFYSVKEAVFPFAKFPGVDSILGPEMKSTGEVMGIGLSFAEAFVKAQLGAGIVLPNNGKIFISVKNQDKPKIKDIVLHLHNLGFEIISTIGTAKIIAELGIPVRIINKVNEGRPNVIDMLKNGEISMVINTVEEKRNAISDSKFIRTQSVLSKITIFTTINGAKAAVDGMVYLKKQKGIKVYSLQEVHESSLKA